MTSLWLLRLSLKCLDHLAWPLVALAYPLCASVQAIETDSYKETRNLISYWILLSLIYLFEYAFSRLLQWFQFWPYIKLMIIFCLITPDFGRASYAYNNLIRTYLSLNPQAVTCRLNKLRKSFVKKDDFLLHAERYVNDNGTEALEKLIASKNTTYKPDAEASKAIRATDNKRMQQTNERKLQTERKAMEDLEVIEKKEIPAAKHNIPPVVPDPATVDNDSPKKVQTEWACALCHVTTTSEKTLIDHQHGRKHKATYQALKAQNQPGKKPAQNQAEKKPAQYQPEKKPAQNQPEKKPEQYQPVKKPAQNQPEKKPAQNQPEKKPAQNQPEKKPAQNQPQKKSAVTSHTKFICEICNVYCPCVEALVSHENGKKHLAKIKTLI